MKSRKNYSSIKIGFLGVGWIGRHRMKSVLDDPRITAAAIADPDPVCLEAASMIAPSAKLFRSLDEMLSYGRFDGVVIATPSAGHSEEAIRVLKKKIPVFCQKPLGRTSAETAMVINTSCLMDKLLGVDLSYRNVRGFRLIREILREGGLGDVYAADFVFHNAYGPDKDWFYDFNLSGGGCLMDLGIHLVDLALWLLEPEGDLNVSGRLFTKGKPWAGNVVEDYASARLDGERLAMSIACSWRLPAGCDSVISASIWGTEGGLALKNIKGSFFDFVTERYNGTMAERIDGPPDDWGGGAIHSWAERLLESDEYDPAIEDVMEAARILDIVYGRCSSSKVTLKRRNTSCSGTDITYAVS